MSQASQPFHVRGWDRITENASKSRGRPKGGLEILINPEQTTRISLGPTLDRLVMAIQTTRTVQNKPVALILGYWAGSTLSQDLKFFQQVKCRKVKDLQKTHWLIIIGDFNARKTKWGDRDNRRGAMLENLSASLGLTRIPSWGENSGPSARHTGDPPGGLYVTTHWWTKVSAVG